MQRVVEDTVGDTETGLPVKLENADALAIVERRSAVTFILDCSTDFEGSFR